MLAFSTLRVLPRLVRSLETHGHAPDLAEPPAESPSTIKSSVSAGLFEEQSASLPGKLEISKPDFLRVTSRARLAATRALAAKIPFSTIRLAICGFSIKKSENASLKRRFVISTTSLFPSLVLV